MKKLNDHIKHAGLLLKRAKNNFVYGRKSTLGPHISLSFEEVKKYNNHRYYGAQKYLCLAPFNSMFLSIDGNVYACNLNRKYILGNIKNNTLKEIWNGPKLAALREYISVKDLTKGCEKCLHNISAGNYDASTSSHYDYVGFDNQVQYPIRLDFEISNICNLGCVMCSPLFSSTIQKEIKGKKLSKNFYNNSILKDLDTYIPHLKFMNFSGGEPFMNNLYYDIWEMVAAKNKTCQVHIQTNGTVLNEKVKAILNKHRFNIGISIDSLQKETYTSIRLFSDFETRQSNLSYFINYCHHFKTTLTFSFCLLKQNANEIPDFVNFANKHNAVLYLSPVFEPYEHAISNLPASELQALKKHYQTYHFNTENDIQVKNVIHFKQFTTQIDNWIYNNENKKLSKAIFSNKEIENHILNKLAQYFSNFKEINGTDNNDIDECTRFIHQLFEENNTEKIDILKNIAFESEERIYNQIKYYWL